MRRTEDGVQAVDTFTIIQNMAQLTKAIKSKVILEPDLKAGVYEGHYELDLQVLKNVTGIALSNRGLACDKPIVFQLRRFPEPDELLDVDEVYDLAEEHMLVVKTVRSLGPGLYRLLVHFTGSITDSGNGFLKLSLINQAASSYAYYRTDDTPGDLFPCVNQMSKLELNVVISQLRPVQVLGNSKENYELQDYPYFNATTISFEETIPMLPTELNFLMGHLERADKVFTEAGVVICTYSRPHMAHLTTFARDTAKTLVEFYSNYFGVPYPLPKLDVVGLPLPDDHGLDTLGLIILDEGNLFIHPPHSNTEAYLTVVRALAFKIAANWFGSLICLKAVEDAWIRVSMSKYFAHVALTEIFPWYKDWLIVDEIQEAMAMDSLPNSPSLHLGAVTWSQHDSPYYDMMCVKGAAIIRMMMDIDSVHFLNGVKLFLQNFQCSWAGTEDLYAALELAEFLPIGCLSSFLNLPSYPTIEVRPKYNTILLKKIVSDTQTKTKEWVIPVRLIEKGLPEPRLVWVEGETDTTACSLENTEEQAWFLLNHHRTGYFRVIYKANYFNNFINYFSTNFEFLDEVNRSVFLDDAFALAQQNQVSYDVGLGTLTYLFDGEERAALPWLTCLAHLTTLNALLANTPAIISTKVYETLLLGETITDPTIWHFEEDPPSLHQHVKAKLLETAASLNIQLVLDGLTSMFQALSDPTVYINSDLKRVVFAHGSTMKMNDIKLIWADFEASDYANKFNYLAMFGSVRNQTFFHNMLTALKNGKATPRQFFFLLECILEAATWDKLNIWEYFKTNNEFIDKVLGYQSYYFTRLMVKGARYTACVVQESWMTEYLSSLPTKLRSLQSVCTAQAMHNIRWLLPNYDNLYAWLREFMTTNISWEQEDQTR